MIPYFKSIGERIENEWRSRSYNEEVFPQLVLCELQRRPPHEHAKIEDIIDWISGPSHTFVQPGTRTLFGEPPVMLFQAPRFYIEALFWFSGTTAIHEHGFSGVFAVLAGASVHSHWRFIPELIINSRMLRGRLERISTDILRAGDMQLIPSGDRLIHQLFHLDLPSVTIVIRTNVDRNHLPQYQYLSPGLAIDPEDHEPLRTRRIMLLDHMARGQLNGLWDYAQKLITSGDMETIYHAFSTLTRRKAEKAVLTELFCLARDLHGDTVDLIQSVCAEERRTRIITALRAKISGWEPRFLLALLMLMPDRDAILETVRLHTQDDDPLAAIERWLQDISGPETIGFEYNATNKLIFRGLVEGLDAERLMARLRAEFQAESVCTNQDRLMAHMQKMANSDLFYPLFSNSPLRRGSRTSAVSCPDRP